MRKQVLGIDYGRKFVGLAIGSNDLKIAVPKDVIINRGISFLVEDIGRLCKDNNISVVIIGLPLNMSSEHQANEIMKDVSELKSMLEEKNDIEVKLTDERLSTFEAGNLVSDIEEKSGKKVIRKDAHAAQIILQRYFDNYQD